MAYKMLPVSDETVAQLYKLVPGLEEAALEEKAECLCRHFREIARRDREDKLALSRLELHNFNADEPRDSRGRWTTASQPRVAVGGTAVLVHNDLEQKDGPATTQAPQSPPPTTQAIGWPSGIKPIPLRPQDNGRRQLSLKDALKLMGLNDKDAEALIKNGVFKEGCKGMYNFLTGISLQYGYKTKEEAMGVVVPPNHPELQQGKVLRMECDSSFSA